jgi:8-oxo-dGTP pyrophosphatase MutT (NUDIX family)
MIEVSCFIFLSKTTGRIMMQLRSDGVTHARKWGFFGGKSENKERPSETLYREIEEEVGKTNITKVIPISKFTSKNGRFIYNSFVVLVTDEFIPDLNKESDGYCWVAIEKWPRPLHPGAKIQCGSKDFLKKVKTIYDMHR